MPPTTTTNRTSFTRPLPSSVTYTLPSTPFAFPVVTITIPPHSTWTSGLHFHAMHTEYLSVVKGTALVTLDGVTNTYTSSDGIITVPRYMKHEWQRGDKGNGEDKDELVVKEWTDPEDGEKEIFFRNLNSAILDATSNGLRKPNEWMLTWQLFTIFWQLDNFPVFLELSWFPIVGEVLERWISFLVLWVASLLGGMVGVRGVREEYTPARDKHQKAH